MATEHPEAEAATLAGHLAAAMCRFLDVVAELDRREAWTSWEARSMAHWVSWKCGVGPRAAQEHVRVARALAELPVTHREFARGQLSFSKVRALTRFVTPDREEGLVQLARHTTANQLERIARAHGVAGRAVDPDRARAVLGLVGRVDALERGRHSDDHGAVPGRRRGGGDRGDRCRGGGGAVRSGPGGAERAALSVGSRP